MATLKKLSGIFYRISKIILIVGIIATAVLLLVNAILGVVALVGVTQMSGTDEEIATAMAGAIFMIVGSILGFGFWEVINILALVFTSKAVNNESTKKHIVAAVFGAISGYGEFTLAAGIISTIFLKRGGKFSEEVTEVEAVDVHKDEVK